MTKNEKKDFQFKVEDEGFDYAVINYGDAKDKRFQEERAIFLNARQSFISYLISEGILEEGHY